MKYVDKIFPRKKRESEACTKRSKLDLCTKEQLEAYEAKFRQEAQVAMCSILAYYAEGGVHFVRLSIITRSFNQLIFSLDQGVRINIHKKDQYACTLID